MAFSVKVEIPVNGPKCYYKTNPAQPENNMCPWLGDSKIFEPVCKLFFTELNGTNRCQECLDAERECNQPVDRVIVMNTVENTDGSEQFPFWK